MSVPDREDWKLVNCAECGVELLGDSMRDTDVYMLQDRPHFIAARILGRPFCPVCMNTRKPPPGSSSGPLEDTSPWQQNALRNWEDGEE